MAIGASIVAALPAFLVGALAVQLTSELGFGVAGLGMAIAFTRVSSALSATYLGRLTDRIGALASLRIASVLVAVACLGIAVAASSLATLIAWLAVVGPAHSLATPAANRLLVRRVPSQKQGLAFGIKQSAPPVASMLAGFSVPLVADGASWRFAFVGCSLLAIAALLLVGRGRASERVNSDRKGTHRLKNRRAIVALVFAFGMSTAASSSVPVFFVSSAVESGLSEGTAGLMLAGASLFAVLVRVVMGGACDYLDSGYLTMCGISLLGGVMGFLAIASGDPGLQAVGVAVAMGGAWGFAGAFWFAVMRAWSENPGRVTGTLAPGGLTGGTLGPIAFGAVANSGSFASAWIMVAVLASMAAALMFVAARFVSSSTQTG